MPKKKRSNILRLCFLVSFFLLIMVIARLPSQLFSNDSSQHMIISDDVLQLTSMTIHTAIVEQKLGIPGDFKILFNKMSEIVLSRKNINITYNIELDNVTLITLSEEDIKKEMKKENHGLLTEKRVFLEFSKLEIYVNTAEVVFSAKIYPSNMVDGEYTGWPAPVSMVNLKFRKLKTWEIISIKRPVL